jgi:hypothetical protein
MTFGLAPPKNVTNLFWNWIQGIPKKDIVQIRVDVCVVIWTIWNTRNYLIFNKKKIILFVGYFFGYPLDLYVVLSQT